MIISKNGRAVKGKFRKVETGEILTQRHKGVKVGTHPRGVRTATIVARIYKIIRIIKTISPLCFILFTLSENVVFQTVEQAQTKRE